MTRTSSRIRTCTSVASLIVVGLFTFGCSFAFRALGRNLAVPQTPRAVQNRIQDPRRADARLAVLWVGHATVLLQLDDLFILTDPVFTRTVGGLSPRLVEPGIAPEHLPRLAAVLVSHMHFDHLSFGSLELIEGKTQMLLVPKGVRAILPRYDFPSRELDAWDTYASNDLRVTAVPVHHVGGRWGIDQAWSTHAYTGYVIEYHGLTVYFGGDTGFSPSSFRATRQRFGNLDLALLPICPNEPRGFMQRTHMGPGQALDAFQLLGAKRLVPIHFDTFVNSDDLPGECPRLLQHLATYGHLERQVSILEIGEERTIVAK